MKYLENLNPVIKTRSLDISLFLELWCQNTKGYHLVKKMPRIALQFTLKNGCGMK